MKIICLVENNTMNSNYRSEHGLSLYVELNQHRLLFDLGQGQVFIENAEKMNIDLTSVDIVVISHGHYDHGGGLEAFLNINNHAKVYIHVKAFNRHFSENTHGELKDIGLDSKFKVHPQVILTESYFTITQDILLFSDIKDKVFFPSGNQFLKQIVAGSIANDDFSHEQNMILIEDNQYVLFAGCAHKGILNIINTSIHLMKKDPKYVFSGFHLQSRNTGLSERMDFVTELGSELVKFQTTYYTGHCTGAESFDMLHEKWGDRFKRFTTGIRLIS